MRDHLQFLRVVFVVLTLSIACTASAFAQETTARLSGQVTDSAGAVVNNAEVSLTNPQTREARTSKTNDEGYFSFTLIPPGKYDLSVKLQGFKQYLSKDIELNVNDHKTINVPLETGSISETVTITSEAPQLQTSPTVGDVIENRRVVELPLNNRNFMQLITLVPGVTSTGDSEIGIGLTNTVNISIGGQRRNSINFLVDGVMDTDVGSNITLLSVPTVDSIQEFRVITSVPTAEFGRSGGGVVNLITRSGTRQFHGGVYEFVRNDKLNANSFFNNSTGRNADGTLKAPRPKLRYNNYGYNLGGPILLPRFGEGGPSLYGNKREKSFFFFSEEWRRVIRQPAQNIATVPSLLERTGDFSETGNLTIFDPLTGLPFSGNKIPTNRIDPTAAALVNIFPIPNIASTTAGTPPATLLMGVIWTGLDSSGGWALGSVTLDSWLAIAYFRQCSKINFPVLEHLPDAPAYQERLPNSGRQRARAFSYWRSSRRSYIDGRVSPLHPLPVRRAHPGRYCSPTFSRPSER